MTLLVVELGEDIKGGPGGWQKSFPLTWRSSVEQTVRRSAAVMVEERHVEKGKGEVRA
jgi:hypothetical protein